MKRRFIVTQKQKEDGHQDFRINSQKNVNYNSKNKSTMHHYSKHLLNAINPIGSHQKIRTLKFRYVWIHLVLISLLFLSIEMVKDPFFYETIHSTQMYHDIWQLMSFIYILFYLFLVNLSLLIVIIILSYLCFIFIKILSSKRIITFGTLFKIVVLVLTPIYILLFVYILIQNNFITLNHNFSRILVLLIILYSLYLLSRIIKIHIRK